MDMNKTTVTKPQTDAPRAIREMTEKSATQTKETYEKMSAATGEVTDLIKASCSTALKGMQEYNDKFKANAGDISRLEEKFKKQCGEDGDCILKAQSQFVNQLVADGKLPHVSWELIVAHIDHFVKLIGPDHVGLGSDFDGADMPEGLEDASKLPQITEALVRKGYSDADIRKILGGNTLRVMEQAEAVSRGLRSQQ